MSARRIGIAAAVAVALLISASASAKGTNRTGQGAASALLDRLVKPRQPGPMAPRDECARVAGARAFRESVASAVVARDANALVRLASPQVQLGFGGDNGTTWLRRNASARDGAFWTNLAEAISLGCAVAADGSIAVPWVYTQEPGGLDPFDALLVKGAGVPLRAEPAATARVLQMLDWQFVELAGPWEADAAFVKVRTAGKVEGYIAMAAQRGATETRVIAERTRAGWRITAIVAGD